MKALRHEGCYKVLKLCSYVEARIPICGIGMRFCPSPNALSPARRMPLIVVPPMQWGTPRYFSAVYTRSHASGGIQWAAIPSHLILQPIGFVTGIEIGFPAVSSSRAISRLLTVIRDISRGLSTPLPV